MTKNESLKKIKKIWLNFMLRFTSNRFQKTHVHKVKNYCHKYTNQINTMHNYLRVSKPIWFTVSILVILFLINNTQLKALGIALTALLFVKEIFLFILLSLIGKVVFKPVSALKVGVEEIAKGNYDVKISCQPNNELGLLVDSFNNMAEKLKKSEELKKEYEENRKLLIANISHDLKTPITSIQGYIEVIRENKINDKKKISQYLTTIYKNTDYLNKLIDDLILFSKLDINRLEFNLEKINISDYMNDLMAEFKFEVEEKGIKFNFTNQLNKPCIIEFDRKRLHQAIRNIISNSIKYGNKRNLEIKTILYCSGDVVCTDISDNGCGISTDILPNIFNRFYRLDNERTKDLLSSGLGLSIAKELIESQNGSITVASEENKYTLFTIKLPKCLN